MFVFAIVSGNGGAGRTTVTANLASLMARRGRKVLALDMDPRNALGLHLGLPLDEHDGFAARLAAGTAWNEAAFVSSDQVQILPFGELTEDQRLSLEIQMMREPAWLSRRLAQLQLSEQSIVLIDTPRLPSVYASQGMSAAHGVLNVLTADTLSYAQIPQIEASISSAERKTFHLLNQIEGTRRLQGDLIQLMRHELGERLSPYALHRDEAIAESFASNCSLLDHAPHSQVTHDFQGLTTWALKIADSPRA